MHTATELPSSPARARPTKQRKAPAKAIAHDPNSLAYLRLCADHLRPLLADLNKNERAVDRADAYLEFARGAIRWEAGLPALLSLAIAEVERRCAAEQTDPVFAAIAKERKAFAAYEALKARVRGRPNEDELIEPGFDKWVAAERRVAKTVPTTLAGPRASAAWFVAHMEHAPIDAVEQAWPHTVLAALASIRGEPEPPDPIYEVYAEYDRLRELIDGNDEEKPEAVLKAYDAAATAADRATPVTLGGVAASFDFLWAELKRWQADEEIPGFVALGHRYTAALKTLVK